MIAVNFADQFQTNLVIAFDLPGLSLLRMIFSEAVFTTTEFLQVFIFVSRSCKVHPNLRIAICPTELNQPLRTLKVVVALNPRSRCFVNVAGVDEGKQLESEWVFCVARYFFTSHLEWLDLPSIAAEGRHWATGEDSSAGSIQLFGSFALFPVVHPCDSLAWSSSKSVWHVYSISSLKATGGLGWIVVLQKVKSCTRVEVIRRVQNISTTDMR